MLKKINIFIVFLFTLVFTITVVACGDETTYDPYEDTTPINSDDLKSSIESNGQIWVYATEGSLEKSTRDSVIYFISGYIIDLWNQQNKLNHSAGEINEGFDYDIFQDDNSSEFKYNERTTDPYLGKTIEIIPQDNSYFITGEPIYLTIYVNDKISFVSQSESKNSGTNCASVYQQNIDLNCPDVNDGIHSKDTYKYYPEFIIPKEDKDKEWSKEKLWKIDIEEALNNSSNWTRNIVGGASYYNNVQHYDDSLASLEWNISWPTLTDSDDYYPEINVECTNPKRPDQIPKDDTTPYLPNFLYYDAKFLEFNINIKFE